MAARVDQHGAAFLGVRIDGDAGLHVGVGRIAVGRARAAEADVLMEAEVGGGARRLPVHLVDDLLEIDADQRPDDCQHARIAAHLVEHGIEIRRPLHVADDVPDRRIGGDPPEDVAVAEASRMGESLGPDAIERIGHHRHLVRPEDAADDGIAALPIGADVLGFVDPGDPGLRARLLVDGAGHRHLSRRLTRH